MASAKGQLYFFAIIIIHSPHVESVIMMRNCSLKGE